MDKTIFNQSKNEREIPGFGLEHWLESLLLADTEGATRARQHVGINTDLMYVVSQVPIIKKSEEPEAEPGSGHIDLLSSNKNSVIQIVELKIDNKFRKAVKELNEYTNWLLRNDEKHEFDPERRDPKSMQKKYYIPKKTVDLGRLTTENVEAIAVVKKPPKNSCGTLKNLVKLRVIELPDSWLENQDGNPFGV